MKSAPRGAVGRRWPAGSRLGHASPHARAGRGRHRAHCDSGEPYGAGAYGVQGLAGAFVASLSGSYTGVMGLPVFETAALLRAVGIRIP